jgi:DNA-directed RNA polymerase subunit N (RpoN/RPB10)
MNYYSLPVIRCITCNKPIAHLFEQYQMLINMGHDASESFDIIDDIF